MKKYRIAILLVILSIVGGIIARDRGYGTSGGGGTTDVNYTDLAAAIDPNDLADPNSHDAVTVTETESVTLTLSTQDISADVNETYLDTLYQPVEATLTDIADGTITENLVNTTNPWADNEVADDITASNYLDLATYDVSGDGYADGNDTAYDITTWNGDVNAPSMNVVRDILALMDTDGDGDIDNIESTLFVSAADMNEYVQDQVGTMLPSGYTYADDTNDITREYYKSFSIAEPNIYYTNSTNHRFCFDPNSEYAVTVTEVAVQLEADPTTEIDANLKFADAYIGVANATLIVAIDTTSGTADVDSGFNDATVPAGKAWYIEFDAQPDADTEEMLIVIRGTYD